MKDYQVELVSERRTILQIRVRAKSREEAMTVGMNRAKDLGYDDYTVTKVSEI
jgi:hypothetical protein